MFPDKVREILEHLLNSQEEMTQDNFFDVKERIKTLALAQLLALIESELLPKEKDGARLVTAEECLKDVGFNQAIHEIKEKLKKGERDGNRS